MSSITAKVVIDKCVIFACRAALATETTTEIGFPDQKKLRHTVEERVESKMDFCHQCGLFQFPRQTLHADETQSHTVPVI